MPNGKPALAFIGFGEAGQAIAAGLREAGLERMSASDILFPKADGEKLLRAAEKSGVRCAGSAADAIRDADIIIIAVTAASSVEAARSVKTHLAGKPFFLDINSVSPGRKQETAKLLGDAARYVDAAVLAPIYPARHHTPMLLAGPDAVTIAPTLSALGMRVTVGGAEVGAAAAIKMVRSAMIKGIEALTLEF
jgi:3-hydroxyisobutyrate dehydrogenase-like beta-hydroxyacid dehydrogenase